MFAKIAIATAAVQLLYRRQTEIVLKKPLY
jgi:hypothetical protein